MIRVPEELRAILGDRATELVTLSRYGEYDQVCALTDEVTADPARALTPSQRMLLALARMGAALNAGIDEEGKWAEVAAARPLVARVPPDLGSRFHAVAAKIASLRDSPDGSIDEVIAALALADAAPEPTGSLALALSSAISTLVDSRLYPLAVETGQRSADVAAAVGMHPSDTFESTGVVYFQWAMKTEHLGAEDDAVRLWDSAAEHLALAVVAPSDPRYVPLREVLYGTYRAIAAARLAEPVTARRLLDEARAVQGAGASPPVRWMLTHAEGAVLLAEGRLAEARVPLEEHHYADEHPPVYNDDSAYLLGVLAQQEGNAAEAIRWFRLVHERTGRVHYAATRHRAGAARLQIEQRALLRHARELERDTERDPLTGAAERHAFERALPRVVRAARAAGTGLTLLVLDVDRLGWITEAYGRDVGDEVLREVAGLLATYVPSPDRCARWGDDAFVLCLPAPAGKAAGAADRLVRAVASHPWSTVRTGLAVTATASLTELRAGEEPADLLARVPRR